MQLHIRNLLAGLSLASIALLSSCKPSYEVKEITCETITINNTLDEKADPQMRSFIDFYKQQIDSVMNKQIGYASQTLASGKPQSLLANFTADILRIAGEEYTKEPIQLAFMNNGGLRAPINQGPITVGDVYKVFPFENALVVLKLTGEQVNEVFKRLAAIGGEGMSGCQLVIRNNAVESLLVDGKPVDPKANYWVATIDYLADGNSGMSVLEKASERINTGVRLREVMLQYIQDLTGQGKEISSQIDNRVNVLP